MALGDEVHFLREKVTALSVSLAALSAKVAGILDSMDALNAARSDEGRIVDDDLGQLREKVATLYERVAFIQESTSGSLTAHSETARTLTHAQHDHGIEIALLKREIEDYRNWKADYKQEGDERSRQFWAFGPSLLGAVIGGLITAAIAYFITRR